MFLVMSSIVLAKNTGVIRSDSCISGYFSFPSASKLIAFLQPHLHQDFQLYTQFCNCIVSAISQKSVCSC